MGLKLALSLHLKDVYSHAFEGNHIYLIGFVGKVNVTKSKQFPLVGNNANSSFHLGYSCFHSLRKTHVFVQIAIDAKLIKIGPTQAIACSEIQNSIVSVDCWIGL